MYKMNPFTSNNQLKKPECIVQADLGINPCMYGRDCMAGEQLASRFQDYGLSDLNLHYGAVRSWFALFFPRYDNYHIESFTILFCYICCFVTGVTK